MNRKNSWSAFVVGAGLAGAAQAQSQLSTYNLIVRDTLAQANRVYGRVIVQNINLAGEDRVVEVGTRLGSSNSDGITPIPSQSTPSLLVGGYINANDDDDDDDDYTIRVMNGSAFLDNTSGSAPSSRISLQQSSNGATIQRANPTGSSQAATFDSVFNAVVTEASTYATRASNASFSSSGNTTTFTIPASTSVRQVVFSLTEAQAETIFENQNGQVQFNLNGRQVSSIDSIIVNIAGFDSGANFSNLANFLGTITSDLSFRSRVLWNFHQHDGDITLDRSWYGSILAPEATLEGDSDLVGSAAVKNILFNAEIHGPAWTGVPEPSTYAAISFVVAVGGMTVWRRRRASKV